MERGNDGRPQHCPSCFSLWKDIIIPSFVEEWTVAEIRRRGGRSSQDRLSLACFHGTTESSDTNAIRDAIYALDADYPDDVGLSIGGLFPSASAYFDRLSFCHFCLVPKGLGFWTHRLYEVVFSGCIPVILSDEVELPFGDFIDWPAMTIKWPMNKLDHLVNYLHVLISVHPDIVAAKVAALAKYRCWLNYHSKDPNCSPYIALNHLLKRRKNAFPKYATEKHWGTTYWKNVET